MALEPLCSAVRDALAELGDVTDEVAVAAMYNQKGVEFALPVILQGQIVGQIKVCVRRRWSRSCPSRRSCRTRTRSRRR